MRGSQGELERGVRLIGRQQREANKTIDVVTSQLKAVADKVQDWSKIVIAYEPIWYAVVILLRLKTRWARQC